MCAILRTFKPMRIILLVAFLMGLLETASAEVVFDDGNSLHAQCQIETSISNGYCLGYVAAVADAMVDKRTLSGRQACLPRGVMRGQAMDVVKAWLTKHPEKRHFEAWGLVARALSEAWPCPK